MLVSYEYKLYFAVYMYDSQLNIHLMKNMVGNEFYEFLTKTKTKKDMIEEDKLAYSISNIFRSYFHITYFHGYRRGNKNLQAPRKISLCIFSIL